jgi:DNA-binding transcriptional LysR family regulator
MAQQWLAAIRAHGGLYAWESEKNGRELKVCVEGQLVLNSITPIFEAALAGTGVAYLLKHQVHRYLDSGQRVQVLADWSAPFSGYHLFCPSRRQTTPAFAQVVEALRFRSHAAKGKTRD